MKRRNAQTLRAAVELSQVFASRVRSNHEVVTGMPNR